MIIYVRIGVYRITFGYFNLVFYTQKVYNCLVFYTKRRNLKREIEKILREWKQSTRRRPLLVRGARQVGKTYTITEFGEREFVDSVVVNFEQYPKYKECFKSLNPKEIIGAISIFSKKDIVPGESLLFLDEIQECPEAIMSLRYFYEQMPDLHVIAAGSLLEFVISHESFRMPVGRVQYLYMKPLSFFEFLNAIDENRSIDSIEQLNKQNSLDSFIHEHILSLVKKYFIIGGMPAVVSEYISTRNFKECFKVQEAIIQTFRDDFGKYASKAKYKYIQKVFYAVPKLLGKKFKYSHVNEHTTSREIKDALEILEQAGIVYRIKKTSGEGLPLEAKANERHFKTIFLDIGLVQNICGLSEETLISEDLIRVNSGAVAEQFVAQELLAYQDTFRSPSLYYWVREARNSSAEVDYIVPHGPYIVPIEVKSGKTGRLRSINLYLKKYNVPIGLRISQQPYNINLPIISIPFYAVKYVHRLTRDFLSPFR